MCPIFFCIGRISRLGSPAFTGHRFSNFSSTITFQWKKKFASKGILNEQWPYYEAMAQYVENQVRRPVKKKPRVVHDHYDDGADDDYEDDMKLFDLKQRLQVKPKYEEANSCRSCWNEEACINIFDRPDVEGFDIAYKLRTIGGVEVIYITYTTYLKYINCFCL